ncbi:MAG: hypothetical protein ACUVQ8_04650 [Nitrososphaeria archaeon]
MGNIETIENIPVKLDFEEFTVAQKLGRIDQKGVVGLIEESRKLVEPKAVYVALKVVGVENGEVFLENDHKIQSPVLADLVTCGQTIVPHAVTIGPKLEEQASKEAKNSVFRSFILERIGDFSLRKARNYVQAKVEEKLGAKTSRSEPGAGTGKTFSIEQQKMLFQMLDPYKYIGVRLLPSLLMVPRKSSSGVFAAVEHNYIDCQHCPARCDYRKEPYVGEYQGASSGQNWKVD